jgi:hypothetical protein
VCWSLAPQPEGKKVIRKNPECGNGKAAQI